jgi:RHS repeat-associated protein
VTTSYLWCGSDICQARNASNSTIRSHYDEGEYLPGTPAQKLYYGIDQIGSVRRVFASTSSAPAYGYDPYGVPLQVTAPLTDLVYGGMFYNADSGLYLTQYRAYDPVPGRWLSRDALGELSETARSGTSMTVTETLGSTVALASNSPPAGMRAGYPSVGLINSAIAGHSKDVRDELIMRALPLSAKLPPQKAPPLYIAGNSYDFEGTANLYAYASLNPISQVDPDGLQVKFLGPGGGGRICGIICGGYGFRMDYAPNPGPTILHFHFGPLSAGGDWGGHRPWYAPWCVY